jgi:hypothetical protein
MTTLLILFFLSLTGISFMIGKKLIFLKEGNITHIDAIPKLIPDLETIKYTISKKTKKGGYLATVTVLRLYIQSSNLFKYIYNKTKEKIEEIKKNVENNTEQKEASKFLKMISDYKYKVRNIKRQIEEEEK